MSSVTRAWMVGAAMVAALAGSQLTPVSAAADPETQPQPQVQTAPAPDALHNITYRARVDGVSRGATISYTAQGDQMQTANPTMLPGRTFEANTVLPASDSANMRVSIDWPYSANLHCEILVDGAVAAKADNFIGPRLTPARDDPDYGSLRCEAPVSGVANTAPAAPDAPPAPAAPAT